MTKRHSSICMFAATLLIVYFHSSAVSADSVYTWKDNKGRVIYGTNPPPGKAKEANLPAINRENLSQKINNLRQSLPPNCLTHGGTDCNQGPDTDGSVICLDGYRDAVLPFRFKCVAARLSVTRLDLLDTSDKVIENFAQSVTIRPGAVRPAAIKLVIRNKTNVTAFGMKVTFTIPGLRDLAVNGPQEVEPFGVADYILPLGSITTSFPIKALSKLDYSVSCTNCAAITKKR